MTKNMAAADRILRAILGLYVLSLLFWGPKSYWALLGLIPLVTGVSGFCLPYQLLGINTCGKKAQKA